MDAKRKGSSGGAGAAGPSAMAMKKVDRRIVEKNRRIKMKRLCYNLVSILPSPNFDPSKESVSMTQQDHLEQATNYIVQLRERVQQLKEKKDILLAKPDSTQRGGASSTKDSRYPIMELKDLGSCLQVILISGKQKSFMLFQVISVLEDEGAEVVGVNVVYDGDKVYHTLHAQAKSPRVVETSRLGGRLHELISDVTPNFKYNDHIDYVILD